jgi:hypothetical protein
MSKPFPFYSTVRDRASGFTGMVLSYHSPYGQAVQVAIQPKCEDGNPRILPDALLLDAAGLELVAGPAGGLIAVEPIETETEVGDYVQDVVTGVAGTAISKIESASGCISFLVQPEASKKDSKKGRRPMAMLIPAQRSVVLAPAHLAPDPASVDKPGGPAVRMPHQKAR